MAFACNDKKLAIDFKSNLKISSSQTVTHSSDPQQWPTTVTHYSDPLQFHYSDPQQWPTAVTHYSDPLQWPTTVTHNSDPQQWPTTVTHYSNPLQWPSTLQWLTDSQAKFFSLIFSTRLGRVTDCGIIRFHWARSSIQLTSPGSPVTLQVKMKNKHWFGLMLVIFDTVI